ncbi:MAG: HigA family addiction module antidote protein [Spirochaetaceae bacterium]|jgi:addiction module HigA family antidote|nr:HigA family addiction module antidote protein [Spirochaetaceae bacterium]
MAKQTILVPGAVLKEQYLDKYGITVSKLSEDIGLSPSAIRQLINGRLKISLEIALKLEKYFEKPVKYWIDLQNAYSLAALAKDPELQKELKNIPKAQKIPVSKKTAGKADGKKGAAPKGVKNAAEQKPAAGKQSQVKAGRKPRAGKSQNGAAV